MTSTDTFCTNPDTSELYQNNEQCEPESFAVGCPQSSCTDDACPTCVFHKYGPSMAESWLQVSFNDILKVFLISKLIIVQVYNVFGLFWLLFFMSALGEMVLAGSVSGWYWTLDKVD